MGEQSALPFVSIIISSYNDRENLRECLFSLRALNYPKSKYEVIVVDAGSTDGSPEMVEREFPEVKLIRAERIGIAEAINKGIKHARGDYLVLELNTDEVVDRNWLMALVDVIMRSPDVGIATGKRLIYGTNTIESVGGKVDYLTGRVIVIGYGEPSRRYSSMRDVDCAFVFLMRKDVIRKIGLFDEDYYIYFEDVDICLRARRAGFRIVYVPEAWSWHKGSSVIGRGLRAYYYVQRNLMRLAIKNFDVPYMLSSLFCWLFLRPLHRALVLLPPIKKLLLSIGPPFSGLAHSDLEHLRLLVKAILWNLANLKQTMRSRHEAFARASPESV